MEDRKIAGTPVDNVLKEFHTSLNGLSQNEAEKRILEYGRNEIGSNQTGWVSILLRQFKSPFFYLLLLAFGVSLSLGEKLDAYMILAFVLINAVLGFFQEYRSEQTVALLKKYIASKVQAIRNGKETLVEAAELVPGDIILLAPGDIIPGDVRIVDSYDLTIDESVLTGESEPVAKGMSETICFSGSTVASGKGKAVVFATGENTKYGDIARLATQTKKESTFEKELGRLSKFILVLVTVTLIFVVGANSLVKNSFHLIEFLLFAIALSVSVIPEALPVVTTFSLSIGARHLAKRSVVVKRLSAIEDLGSIELLCSDKTGTLTENVLEVSGVSGDDPVSVLVFASLASTYSPDSRNAGNNAFEVAIGKELGNLRKVALLGKYKRVHEIPFDPERKRTTALVQKGKESYVISRGAPEAILPLCAISKKEKREMEEWISERGRLGIRVLAVANKGVKMGEVGSQVLEKEEKAMDLLGFIAFTDPIKKSTFDALTKAKALGVQVKILTGDSPLVAGAVAKEIGLIDNPEDVITGDEFEKLTNQKQHEEVLKHHVFARVTPQQKYKIIELLKEKHEVGFLGEGINDAPALKISNVAMVVQSASDVAREASDIVLLDRSLSVIIDGIHEGRAVFANTSKYIMTTLSANFGNFFAVAIVSLIIDYLPMLPLQILLVNLLSDFPMISVATDTVDSSEVATPNRYDLKTFAFLSILLGVVSTFFDFVFFASFQHAGASVLQTNWFIGSILTELIFIFSARTRKFFARAKFPSWSLIVLAIIAAEATISIPYTGIGHNIFKFTSPTPQMMGIILGIVGIYFVTTEAVKLLYYKTIARPASHTSLS